LQNKNQNYISDIKKFVNSQSRSILIELIEKSPEISLKTIDRMYEKYRYGLKPGFTLFWAKRNNDIYFDKSSLETKIKEFIDNQTYKDDAKFKNLKYKTIIEFNGTYEISMSYLQKFNYINEDGEFTYVYIMKECFAWIGIDKNFIAINNMPDSLMNILKRFFSNIYSADITNVKITNSLLKKVFPSENARKITRHNSNPPENQLEKVTFADQNLGDKRDCIPEGYENYTVISTQYTEEIDENTIGTVGVNCNKGKLYLSKTLTVTQFRDWSTKRIKDVISYYQNSTEITLDSISGFSMFSSTSWESVKQKTIPILDEIAFALISCKKNGIDSYPIPLDLHKVYCEFGKEFISKVHCNCDMCEEEIIPSCNKCGGTHFTISKKSPAKIICEKCGDVQTETFVFDCENGHTITVPEIGEVLELIATDEFTQHMFSTIKLYFPDIIFDTNEYFSISNGNLTLHQSPNYEKLKPSDIVEFNPIANRTLSASPEKLHKILKHLKEKCTNSSIENCSRCKYNIVESKDDIKCMLKLFEKFEGYTLQPHHGHEFGDVSMLVNLNGKNVTFLGVAKSVSSTGAKITKSSKLGREIIQQVIDAFTDSRAEIIGVIYPDIIDSQLTYLLYNEAKVHNKKIVILDKDFMVKLLDSYVEGHDLQI